MKSFKRISQEKLQVRLKINSFVELRRAQAKLLREASGEANILALQQGYRASSEAILLGHA